MAAGMTAACLVLSLAALAASQEMLYNGMCNVAADRGECNQFLIQWHYDRFAHRCRQFFYGGCGGNANRFASQSECERQCSFGEKTETEQKRERCSQKHDPGQCQADIERFHFDWNTKQCVCSTWTGCGGNNNLFYSFPHCMQICGEFAEGDGGLSLIKSPGQMSMRRPLVPQQSVYQRDPLRQQTRYSHTQQIQQRMQQAQQQVRHRSYAGGHTQIIRHGEDGSATLVKTIKMHPLELTRRLMQKIRSGQAASLDEAIVSMSDSSDSAPLSPAPNLPNYVYISSEQPAQPVFARLPQIDPVVRRRMKEKMKKKVPPRRIFPEEETLAVMRVTARPPLRPSSPPLTTRRTVNSVAFPSTTSSPSTTSTTSTTPRPLPTTTRPQVIVLPVDREELPPHPETLQISRLRGRNGEQHVDIHEEDDEEAEMEEEEETVEIATRLEPAPTTPHIPPTPLPRRTPPPPPPTPALSRQSSPPPPRRETPSPLHRGPPPLTSGTLNLRPPPSNSFIPPAPVPRLSPSVATTKKSLWSSYESEEDMDVEAVEDDEDL